MKSSLKGSMTYTRPSTLQPKPEMREFFPFPFLSCHPRSRSTCPTRGTARGRGCASSSRISSRDPSSVMWVSQQHAHYGLSGTAKVGQWQTLCYVFHQFVCMPVLVCSKRVDSKISLVSHLENIACIKVTHSSEGSVISCSKISLGCPC